MQGIHYDPNHYWPGKDLTPAENEYLGGIAIKILQPYRPQNPELVQELLDKYHIETQAEHWDYELDASFGDLPDSSHQPPFDSKRV